MKLRSFRVLPGAYRKAKHVKSAMIVVDFLRPAKKGIQTLAPISKQTR